MTHQTNNISSSLAQHKAENSCHNQKFVFEVGAAARTLPTPPRADDQPYDRGKTNYSIKRQSRDVYLREICLYKYESDM